MILRETKQAPLTHEEMDSNFKSVFGIHNLFYVEDKKPSGTHGGSFTAGAWRTRDLNTIKINNIQNADLINNEIILPKGKYWCEIRSPAYWVDRHLIRLFNITTNEVLCYGSHMYTLSQDSHSGAAAVNTYSDIRDTFELTNLSNLRVEHICSKSYNNTGFGIGHSFDAPNIYTQCLFWKIGE